MKRYIVFLFGFILMCVSGCSIDYDSYYEKYGDVYNKDTTLVSEQIADATLHYPITNVSLI